MDYAKYVDLGEDEPVLMVNAQGTLMFSAIAAYEEGNPKAEALVDQTLALAAEKGYTQGAAFRAAFRRTPVDPAERRRRVEAVFAVLDPWEFMHRIMAPLLAAARCERHAPDNPRSAPGSLRSLH
jgi:hypothetical protein